MTRYINALLVFLMVLSAAAVYDMKYEAELASEEIAHKEAEVGEVKEDISLLKAEWALLTRPARMQDLVNRHHDSLDLVPMTADHIARMDEIPDAPADPAPAASQPGSRAGVPQDHASAEPASAGLVTR